ncbi:unnamed protein product [Rotaria sp. Silwood1]|nr:unnamed protein product [Rotaria sp. Silwood1]CAF3692223.1 unnamed protein product [Rotaria sp. Silwood1]CAF4817564.1 unnamed protein product [Rotaria sp. Silwood1]
MRNLSVYLVLLWYYAFSVSDGLTDKKIFRPSATELSNPKVYPQRSIYGIKAIQPDQWKVEDIAGNGAGGIAINTPWADFQPQEKRIPCSNNEIAYDGYCFIPARDSPIKTYTDRQLMITAVLIIPPAWARQRNTDCKQANQAFCAPDNAAAFGRFAGFLAWHYNGQNGKGRITEFVIMNEVNAAEWYNIGCGNGKPCNIDAWVQHYAQVYIAAYDQIRREQPQAPVLVSLEHHFDTIFDQYASATNPFMSGRTFITKLVPKLGNRQWALAYHPYPPSLLRAEFGPNDWPKITFGNINRLVGWLMQSFPNTSSAHKVYLTENGINSIAPNSDQNKQHDQLCAAFEIMLATPNVDLFVYHRMKDHIVEIQQGLGLGLVDTNGNYKRAWSLWAMVNRFDVSPSKLSCGFQNLPYVVLKRARHQTNGHISTTRPLPAGYTIEQTWKLFREPQPNTKLIFECQRKTDQRRFPSVNQHCENQDALGPLGYIYTNDQTSVKTVAIYRCRLGSDYFVSSNANCEQATNEGLLGYAVV